MDLFSSENQHLNLLERTKKLLSIQDLKELSSIEMLLEELRSVIRQHDEIYYKQSDSIISDQDYDQLFSLLKDIESANPSLVNEESPSQKIGDNILGDTKTVKHIRPMLSLENSYDFNDLARFDKRVRDGLSHEALVSYAVELKYDGSSISIVYENDRLTRAATRGNGIEGDDITENAKEIIGIPHRANFTSYGIHKIELRGEVIITLDDFLQLNEERIAQNMHLKSAGKKELELFKNPRNTAAGSLRMKDSEEVKRRKLQAIIYQVGYAEDIHGADITFQVRKFHHEYIELLGVLGFQTGNDAFVVLDDIQQVSDYCLKWQEKRASYHIDIDGMVIKVNSIHQQSQLGKTSHHPKWAIAYKFKARQAHSILRKVEFQVGRTGAVTPVAKIDPVQLMGVEISSISLHNEDFILQKNIHLGDTVVVERAGDVIPYIVGVLEDSRNDAVEAIIFPEFCPSCYHKLVRPEDESVWRCINPDCIAQIEERLIHFVSVNAMDIQGLGQEYIRTFIKNDIIQSITDIYHLDYDKILTLEGFKQKTIQNLQKNIEISKSNESWRLLTGLGIRHIGVTTAKTLTKEVKSLLDFQKWSLEDFQNLKDIGPKVASSLFEFFNDTSNILLLEKLEELGVNLQSSELVLNSNRLEGMTFLFTGTMPTLSRDQAKDLVEKNGGKLISSVSANLNYLVAGEKAGSKLTKAEKIASIKIIDEATFLEMIS